jgi:molybdopterin biosynthesis enzyme
VRGETKGPAFKKGHVIREEDICVLLNLGKEHVYIWEHVQGTMHENDAAEVLCEICRGANIERSEVKEGKIELSASIDGLFKVKKEILNKINGLGEIIVAVRNGNFPVKAGSVLAGVRVVPLVIEEAKMNAAKYLSGSDPILNVLPFKNKKAGLIITGNEIVRGRIKDTFTPVIKEKLSEYKIDIAAQTVTGDDHEKIKNSCLEMASAGIDFIICTGGMSVDPDDRTPLAIKNTGARVVSYGVPVLPGSMFMLAYYKTKGSEIPILGLPGCVMYTKRSVFDLVLPRIAADDHISEEDLSMLGYGGLCLGCQRCVFPDCSFGKGV